MHQGEFLSFKYYNGPSTNPRISSSKYLNSNKILLKVTLALIMIKLLFSGIWLLLLTVFLTYYWIAVASHYIDIQAEEAKQSSNRPSIQINL